MSLGNLLKKKEDPGTGRRLSMTYSDKQGTEQTADLAESIIIKNLTKIELVENHVEKTEVLNNLKKKVSLMNNILNDLLDKYQQHKNRCLCLREGYYIEMIAEALEKYETGVLAGGGKKKKKKVPEPQSALQRVVAGGRRLSLAARRLTGAHIPPEPLKDVDPKYNAMNEAQILSEMVQLETDINMKKGQKDVLERKLKDLTFAVGEAKPLWFWSRHKVIAKAIEMATEDCLQPD